MPLRDTQCVYAQTLCISKS